MLAGFRGGASALNEGRMFTFGERGWGTLMRMDRKTANEVPDASWEALEDRIDRIIDHNRTLASENKALREAQRNWSIERADLVRRNELAKSRIEAMISRLKSLADE